MVILPYFSLLMIFDVNAKILLRSKRQAYGATCTAGVTNCCPIGRWPGGNKFCYGGSKGSCNCHGPQTSCTTATAYTCCTGICAASGYCDGSGLAADGCDTTGIAGFCQSGLGLTCVFPSPNPQVAKVYPSGGFPWGTCEYNSSFITYDATLVCSGTICCPGTTSTTLPTTTTSSTISTTLPTTTTSSTTSTTLPTTTTSLTTSTSSTATTTTTPTTTNTTRGILTSTATGSTTKTTTPIITSTVSIASSTSSVTSATSTTTSSPTTTIFTTATAICPTVTSTTVNTDAVRKLTATTAVNDVSDFTTQQSFNVLAKAKSRNELMWILVAPIVASVMAITVPCIYLIAVMKKKRNLRNKATQTSNLF